MKIKHTPGPWELRRDPFHFHTLSSIVGGETRGGEKKFPSHELHVEIGGFSNVSTQEANARLIAAAPDLLNALESCRLYIEAVAELNGLAITGRGTLAQTVTEARAAIAKAKGEDQ